MGLYSKWQSIPVLLPGKSHGQRSLVGYSPWGRKELDMTEKVHFTSLGLEGKLTFSSPMATAEFSKFAVMLSAALSQHHLSRFAIAQLEFHHLKLALFVVMLPKAHLTSCSRIAGYS